MSRRALTVALALALAGCGGGSRSVPPSGLAAGSAGSAMSSGALTLTIPAATAATFAARTPKSISSATQSVGISVNGGAAQLFDATPTSSGCSLVAGATTCTFTLSAPVGNDVFAIATYSGPNGTGAVLDSATMTFAVAAGVRFSFNVTLGPVVSTSADSGPGSLRAAIAQANPGDTITFMPGVTGTIALTNGAITLAQNVTLSGRGAASLTVSGGNSSQIFIVNAGVVASISGLTLANGKGTTGGAIMNAGTLTVGNSTFTNNTAPQTNGEGGAIYNAAGATLSVANSTFSANKAQFGGAIGSESQHTTVTNSTFTSNTAIGPTSSDDSYGGAIYSDDDITIAGSTFSANVSGGGGAPDGGFGGAIVEDNFTADGLTLSNSQFLSNKAGVPASGDGGGAGGALYDDSGDTMVLSGNTFGGSGLGNVASGTSDSYGGAIDAEAGTSISLNAGNTFSYNGVSALSTSSASGGGAIEISAAVGGNLVIAGANTFSNNSVTAGPSATGGYAKGGAIDMGSDGAIDLHAAAGTAFSNNSVSVPDNLGSANGGAIEYAGTGTPGCCAKARRPGPAAHRRRSGSAQRRPLQTSDFAISGVTFTGNGATGGANTMFGVTGGAVDIHGNTTPLTISTSTFASNMVSAGQNADGGAISEDGETLNLATDQINGNIATQAGGGVYVWDLGTLNVTNCTITGNQVTNENHGAEGGGGIAGGGGGILLWSNLAATATVVNSTITGNTSGFDGGGIENLQNYSLSLINATVYGNSANSGSGGSLYNNNGSSVMIQNTIFAGGSASVAPDVDNAIGSMTSSGDNWIQTAVVGAFAPLGSDHVNSGSPQLSAAGLQNNGGPTQTIADLLTSPVAHAIPFAGGVCGASGPATDQRGHARGAGGSCDIGAYEFP